MALTSIDWSCTGSLTPAYFPAELIRAFRREVSTFFCRVKSFDDDLRNTQSDGDNFSNRYQNIREPTWNKYCIILVLMRALFSKKRSLLFLFIFTFLILKPTYAEDDRGSPTMRPCGIYIALLIAGGTAWAFHPFFFSETESIEEEQTETEDAVIKANGIDKIDKEN